LIACVVRGSPELSAAAAEKTTHIVVNHSRMFETSLLSSDDHVP
jgi:hypothetical protein